MMKNYDIFKLSAIHNLRIISIKKDSTENKLNEGLVVPFSILEKADILPWEQVIVTKIKGNNWVNRIKTFVIPGEEEKEVEARGSLAKFLQKGDLICLITLTLINKGKRKLCQKNQFPLFDLGFTPLNRNNYLTQARLDLEYNKRDKIVRDFISSSNYRKKLPRFFLSSLVLNLKVNKTSPSCVRGSAEFPGVIMRKANIKRFQSVIVYNVSRGGAANTYAVPTPPKIVMTTGAMARFAKIGEIVNVASYTISTKRVVPKIVLTDGLCVLKLLKVTDHFNTFHKKEQNFKDKINNF